VSPDSDTHDDAPHDRSTDEGQSGLLSGTRRRFLASAAVGALGSTSLGAASAAADEDEKDDHDDEDCGCGAEATYDWQPTAHDITATDGLRLRVWEQSRDDPAEAVLFVHGASYGAVSMFDPPVPDEWMGWLDHAAHEGQAAFAVDIRGYGDSERPPALEEDPTESDPVVPAAVAARDVRDTLHWIREEQGFDRIHLVGLSSGAWRARALFSNYDPDLATVTLAAGSLGQLGPPEGDLPAWTTQVKSTFAERWLAQVPDGADPDDWIGGESYTAETVIDAVWTAIYETGQAIPGEEEETILNPTNLLQDDRHDPADITIPTLVIRGSSDETITREGALRLYDAVGADEYRKLYTEVAGGTHFLFLEDRRHELFQEVSEFQAR
jgi:alpha-beta hydrolase superfamily lysophospholipase